MNKDEKEYLSCKRLFESKPLNPKKNIKGLPPKYNAYKKRCLNSGREFNLTPEEFKDLMKGQCIYCGLDGGTIDRLDSSIGYTKDNSASCCLLCNTMKLHHSMNKFLNHIQVLYLNNF